MLSDACAASDSAVTESTGSGQTPDQNPLSSTVGTLANMGGNVGNTPDGVARLDGAQSSGALPPQCPEIARLQLHAMRYASRSWESEPCLSGYLHIVIMLSSSPLHPG